MQMSIKPSTLTTMKKLGLMIESLVQQPPQKEKNCLLLCHWCDPTSNFEISTPCSGVRALALPLRPAWWHRKSPRIFLIG